jgi:hypothetical protein
MQHGNSSEVIPNPVVGHGLIYCSSGRAGPTLAVTQSTALQDSLMTVNLVTSILRCTNTISWANTDRCTLS